MYGWLSSGAAVADLPYWQLPHADRVRLRRKPETCNNRTNRMATDQRVALSRLPDALRADAELTALVAQALGVNAGHGLAAAAALVIAHREREAADRG